MRRTDVGWLVAVVLAVFLLLGASQRGLTEGRFRLITYLPGGGPAQLWAPVMMIDSQEGKTWYMGHVKGTRGTPLWIPVAIYGEK